MGGRIGNRSREARTLAAAGMGAEEIAERTGLTPGTAAEVLSAVRRQRAPSVRVEVALTPAAARALHEAARPRGETVETLAAQLLEVVAADALVAAVLDEPERAP